jgi:hypothetical protein
VVVALVEEAILTERQMTEMGMSEQEKNLYRLSKFRLMDDTYMTEFFDGNIPATELLLHILLDTDDMKVESVERQLTDVITQDVITNPYGHSVRLDISAVDSTGKRYDIEVQRSGSGADPKRARFNSSLLDLRLLQEGEPYHQLRDSYVIFITSNDVLGQAAPLYHITRTIKENSHVSFEDGSHILYVNGSYRGDDDVGKLMHDFHCRTADEMYYPILAERAHYLKDSEGGKQHMCEIMEDAVQERARQIAMKMLAIGKLSYQEIADCSGLTLEEVQKLAEKQPA